MSYLTIESLSKSFHDNPVLHDVSMTVNKGEFITLLGPSGCGKSTILRIIAGLTEATNGMVKIDGRDMTNVAPKDREVGMVFQSYALFPNMSVFENVAFGLKMKKIGKQEIEERVSRILALVGLEDKRRAFPYELSGGQQQRVALARSLVTRPKVLLLDEPLSALDAQIRKKLQIDLRNIQRELQMTMILVTHDQEEAMAISDRIYLMHAGRIAQNGTPHSIYTRPENEFVAKFIGHYNVLTRDELTLLLGNNHGISGEKFAIRPESFSSMKIEGAIAVKGLVSQQVMLGGIIRSTVRVKGVDVLMDDLHHQLLNVQIGEDLTRFIQKEDVIQIQ